jgi:hypothetical protein
MPDEYKSGIITKGSPPPPQYRLTGEQARMILHKLLGQRKKNGEEDWPKDILVRLYGNEDCIEIYKARLKNIELKPITNPAEARL